MTVDQISEHCGLELETSVIVLFFFYNFIYYIVYMYLRASFESHLSYETFFVFSSSQLLFQ